MSNTSHDVVISRHKITKEWRRQTGWSLFILEKRRRFPMILELQRWNGRGNQEGFRLGPARWRVSIWPRRNTKKN